MGEGNQCGEALDDKRGYLSETAMALELMRYSQHSAIAFESKFFIPSDKPPAAYLPVAAWIWR